MQYLHDLDIAKDDDVYPPSEDSILLVESFDIRQGERVLEIGTAVGFSALVMCSVLPETAKIEAFREFVG